MTEAILRAAEPPDLQALVDLSQTAFPTHLHWRGPSRQAQRWWRQMLQSKSNEIWVCEVADCLVGMATIIMDIQQYTNERRKLRSSFGLRLCSYVSHPKLAVAKVAGRWAAQRTQVDLCPEGPMISERCRKPVWLASVGLLPWARGRGIGRDIVAFCERRARLLGYDSARVVVDKDNRSPLAFWRKLGYEVTSQDKRQCILAKPFD